VGRQASGCGQCLSDAGDGGGVALKALQGRDSRASVVPEDQVPPCLLADYGGRIMAAAGLWQRLDYGFTASGKSPRKPW